MKRLFSVYLRTKKSLWPSSFQGSAFVRNHSQSVNTTRSTTTKPKIPGVQNIIAVASGKGGVGKSTVAANLALALATKRKKTALLDADIYGPSVPTILGLAGHRANVTEKKLIEPMINYDIKCMSMGFLVPEDAATIWRGPMVMGAIRQLLYSVDWGDVEYMIVDLPPGTGDAQLTLCQIAPLTGAVIVTTPQDLALIDVKRGIDMFQKVSVPIFGIVENMSYFACPKCQTVSHIFGTGGAKSTADKYEVPFLGCIPLAMDIRETTDAGKPIVVSSPDSPNAKCYLELASNVIKAVSDNVEESPKIIVE